LASFSFGWSREGPRSFKMPMVALAAEKNRGGVNVVILKNFAEKSEKTLAMLIQITAIYAEKRS
jgi:hypothetical protein